MHGDGTGNPTTDAMRRDTLGEAVLVPVKSFSAAKVRLSPVLDATQRAHLARTLASAVVVAASSLPVTVVCDDTEVAEWAVSQGAAVSEQRGAGLNRAVQNAAWELVVAGHRRVTVAHADIPVASRLSGLGSSVAENSAALVPDRHGDGTNVISLPSSALSPPGDTSGFCFRYGPGSFAAHLEEVARIGIAGTVIHDDGLGSDIDTSEDLAFLPRAMRSSLLVSPPT